MIVEFAVKFCFSSNSSKVKIKNYYCKLNLIWKILKYFILVHGWLSLDRISKNPETQISPLFCFRALETFRKMTFFVKFWKKSLTGLVSYATCLIDYSFPFFSSRSILGRFCALCPNFKSYLIFSKLLDGFCAFWPFFNSTVFCP